MLPDFLSRYLFICQTPGALEYEQPRQGCLWLCASPPALSNVEVETAILMKDMQQQIPHFGISLNNWSQGQKRAPHMGIVLQFWHRLVCSTWSYRACQSKELLHVNLSSLDLCRKPAWGSLNLPWGVFVFSNP